MAIRVTLFCAVVFFLLMGAPFQSRAMDDSAPAKIIDAQGNVLNADEAPFPLQQVICSGPGCLRLLVYLQSQDKIVGVDDIETRRRQFDARPYALANKQFKKMPIFGEFRGHDNPELILTLDPLPQVVFKTFATMGHDPKELQQKTGTPVIPLEYGDLGANRGKLYASLRVMGQALGKQQRAEEVIAFFEDNIGELERRTASIPEDERPTVFVGGVAHKGPHGYQSTEPGYPPFSFVHARNLASTGQDGKQLQHADIAKEKIVEWNPDVLFLDLATLQLGAEAGGLYELRNDPAYKTLTAVKEGKVYGLLPYNWYTENFGSTLANAWFIGKLLYPERFKDIDPVAKADEIYAFLVGEPVFAKMNELFGGQAFTAVPVQ